jgi:hypothetical protein
VYLPNTLAKKYPNADKEFGWQYVFASRNIATDPRSGVDRRFAIHRHTIFAPLTHFFLVILTKFSALH